RRKTSACRQTIQPFPHCSRRQATARASSANGISAFCRTIARSRAAMTASLGFSAARPITSITVPMHHAAGRRRTSSMSRKCRSSATVITNLLGNRAVETMEGYARSKEPFLLSLHFTAPHWPWEGPDDEEESKRIRNVFHRDGGTQKTYMAMMQSLDSNIGRVLQALDVHGLSSN